MPNGLSSPVCNSQPQGPARFNDANPLCFGLRDGIQIIGGLTYYVRSGELLPPLTSSSIPVVSSRGVACVRNGGNSGNGKLWDTIASTSDATVLTVARVTSTLSGENALAATLSQATTGSPMLGLRTTDLTTPGRILGLGYFGGASRTWGGSFFLPEGADFVGVVRQKYNAFQDLWVDGVQDPNISNFTGGSAGFSNFGRRGSLTPLYLALTWRRALSDDEIVEISRNPWQVFSPNRAMFPVPAIISGPVTIFRPSGGSEMGNWASTSPTLWQAIDEVTPNDTDFITSPVLTSSAQATPPIAISAPLPAGSSVFRLRAEPALDAGQIRVVLYSSAGIEQGASAWATLVPGFQTYLLPVTTTGAATNFRIEARL